MFHILTSRLFSVENSERAEGANLVEYMLIALLVAVAAIVALRALGVEITEVLNRITQTLGG